MMDVLMIAAIILWALVLCWAISASVEEERRNKAREDVKIRGLEELPYQVSNPDEQPTTGLRTTHGRRLPPRSPQRKKKSW